MPLLFSFVRHGTLLTLSARLRLILALLLVSFLVLTTLWALS